MTGRGSEEPPADRGPGLATHLLVFAAGTAAYALLDDASALLRFWPGVALVYLPAGLALALVLRFGPGHAGTVLAGALLAGIAPVAAGFPPSVWVARAVLVTATYGGVGWWLRARVDPRLRSLGDVGWLIGGALVAAAAASAAVTGFRVWAGVVDPPWLEPWAGFFVGDLVGSLALAPVLLTVVFPLATGSPRVDARVRRPGSGEALLQLVALLAAWWAAFGLAAGEAPELFLIALPLLWMGVRDDLPVAALGVLLATLSTSGALHWLREDPRPGLAAASFLLIGAAATLLLSALAEDRERALAELREERAHLARAERLGGMGSWSWELGSDRVLWSDELYRIHGLEPRGLAVGPETYLQGVPPRDAVRARDAIRSAVDEGSTFDFEYHLRTASRGVRVIRSRGEVQEVEGGGVRLTGTCLDITESRRMERELARSARMESLGRLAGGVAHDFNNLLTVVSGHIQILLEDLDPESSEAEDAWAALEAARRGGALTRRLLAFSSRRQVDVGPLDVNAVLDELREMLRQLVPERIALEFELSPALPLVVADRSLVEQIVVNLVLNARDAIHGPGSVRVASWLEDEPARARSPGRWAAVSVEDDGEGMDDEVLERLFEPFFTTKELDRGTGLGLATVHSAVEDLGGWIDVQSEPGVGSAFLVHLPCADEAEAGVEEERS